MDYTWVGGNRFELLQNGEEFFPRVLGAISRARQEVLLETFILFEDKVGKQLHAALLAAAQRGAQVDITIDGWGSPDLSKEFIATLTAAGVRVHVFDPTPAWFMRRIHLFRRMHRKLVVVDGGLAFIGGINYSADHLADFGPEAKQDYAVQAEGPIVTQIHHFMRSALVQGRGGRHWFQRSMSQPVRWPQPQTASLPAVGDAEALFVRRDNQEHTDDIERQYRIAIRLARKRIIIANAYFFPGYSLLRELRKAARRGVEVTLILQGNPDMPIVQTAASMLYEHLMQAGVRIFEYCERPLHGKVALTDDLWSTVGSSNLDPLSLSLNLEANVMIRDSNFNRQLADNLHRLMSHNCQEIEAKDLTAPSTMRRIRSYFLFHVLRRYPAWAGWLPAHTPRLGMAGTPKLPEEAERVSESSVS